MSSRTFFLGLPIVLVGAALCSSSNAQEFSVRNTLERWGPHPVEYVSVSSGLVAFTMEEMPPDVDYFRISLPEQSGSHDASPMFDVFKLALSKQWPVAVYYDSAGGDNVEVTELILQFSTSTEFDYTAFGFSHVVTMDTEYYSIGPQQGTPPDGTLEAGTKVRLLVGGGSYVRVVTEEGVHCSVAADALEKLDQNSGGDDQADSENR